MNAQLFLLIIVSTIFLSVQPALCYDDEEDANVYCGQITNFDSLASSKSKEVVVIFKEMNTINNEEVQYEKQLPKKLSRFKIEKNKLSNDEYIDLLERIIFTLHDKSMCIKVDKKTKKVVNVFAGG